jgi:hypothetical protein
MLTVFCLCSGMLDDVHIAGVPFIRVFHRDGRFIRSPGLFAFAHNDGRRHLILHLELSEAINRHAGPVHPKWFWALAEGLNELLISLASAQESLEGEGSTMPVIWHPEAEVWLEGERPPRLPAEARTAHLLSAAGRN